MMVSSGLFGGNEFHAHFFGTLSELSEHPFAVALLVIVLTLIGIFLALGQHRIDQTGKLMSRRSDRLGFVHAGTHSPEVSAQRRLTAAQSGRRQTQGLSRTIGTALGLAAYH